MDDYRPGYYGVTLDGESDIQVFARGRTAGAGRGGRLTGPAGVTPPGVVPPLPAALPVGHPLARQLRVRDGLAITVGSSSGGGSSGLPAHCGYWGTRGSSWRLAAGGRHGGAQHGGDGRDGRRSSPGRREVRLRPGGVGAPGGLRGRWSELFVTRGFSGAAKAVVIAEYLVLLTGRGSIRFLAAAVILPTRCSTWEG